VAYGIILSLVVVLVRLIVKLGIAFVRSALRSIYLAGISLLVINVLVLGGLGRQGNITVTHPLVVSMIVLIICGPTVYGGDMMLVRQRFSVQVQQHLVCLRL
jgi:hypothetical protein